MESNSQKEEVKEEFLKLKESMECFVQTHDTIDSINKKLRNINKEKLEVIMKELSTAPLRNSCEEEDYLSLPYDEHRNLELCLEHLAQLRPKLLEYNSVIKYCASIDAEKITKLLNTKFDGIKAETADLEKRLEHTILEMEGLEERIFRKKDNKSIEPY